MSWLILSLCCLPGSHIWDDTSVSSAIIQRYLPYILQAALEPINQNLMRPALQAIGFTVKQGLAHPMQCLPILIALETSEDEGISKSAFALHSLLHSKQSTLINTRISESIQMTFQYQSRLRAKQDVHGMLCNAAHRF